MARPLIGIVSRFADQKGFDLIAEIADEMMKENVALVVLGTGQAEYERLFRQLSEKYPERVGVKIGYDNSLAHKIEAGADMFLMPSRYEPCGLNQIYSLRYGTVPVVRATGGLDDTIQNFVPKTQQGTGFKFEEYTGERVAAVPARGAGDVRRRKGLADGAGERHGQGFFVEGFGGVVRHSVRGGKAVANPKSRWSI